VFVAGESARDDAYSGDGDPIPMFKKLLYEGLMLGVVRELQQNKNDLVFNSNCIMFFLLTFGKD
jgi:hypothetical protein